MSTVQTLPDYGNFNPRPSVVEVGSGEGEALPARRGQLAAITAFGLDK